VTGIVTPSTDCAVTAGGQVISGSSVGVGGIGVLPHAGPHSTRAHSR